ncbi:MAG: hypothetical protein IT518_18305 [Burkholderiales bacterium]|nr:hypothetical protein [Burkholderiales bacterium]
MKASVLAVLVSLLASWATPVSGVTSMGTRSCAQWADARSQPGSAERFSAEAWLTGFLSGMAAALDRDILAGITFQTLMGWMDNYCRQSPRSNIGEGSFQLVNELSIRMRARK